MTKGDAKYLKHFNDMVSFGWACGLYHPIEMLVDYGRHTWMPYDQIPEINEFLGIAWNEAYQLCHMRYPTNSLEIKVWVDSYYRKERG